MTVGPTGGLDVESLAYSNTSSCGRSNMINTQPSMLRPFLLKARKNGAKIVVIDPVAHAPPNKQIGTFV